MGAVKTAVQVMLCVFLSAGLMQRATADQSELSQGDYLTAGQYMVAGDYRLVMQTDCNLVLYQNSDSALWSANTNGNGQACFLIMQDDGSALVYTKVSGVVWAVWSTFTSGRNDGAHSLVLQDDGNLVMFNGNGDAIWATGTGSQ